MPTYDRSRYAPRSEVRERTRQTVAAILAESAPILAGGRATDVQRARALVEQRRQQLDLRNQERARETVRENVRGATTSAAGEVSPPPAGSTSKSAEKAGGSSFLDRFGGLLGEVNQRINPLEIAKDIPGDVERIRQGGLGVLTGDNPVESVRRGVRGLQGEQFSGEDLGFVRQLPEGSFARRAAGAVGEELVDPANLFVAAKGPALAARLGRGGRVSRAAANLVEPITTGPFGQRLAAEAVTGAGYRGAAAGADALLEDAPAPVRVAGQFAAGIGGAAISAHAFSAAWPRVARAGGTAVEQSIEGGVEAAADPLLERASRQINGGSGPTAMAIPAARQISQAPAFQTALDYLEAEGYQEAPSELLRSLHMASVVVENDKQGWLSQVADRVPGLSRLVHADRPGLDMPENVLAAYVAQGSVSAEIQQRAMVSKFEFITKAREAFGNAALEGGQSDQVRFIGTAAEAAVTTPEGRPIVRTLVDIAQRPDLYDLTPQQAGVLHFGNLRNEELRTLANVGYGTDIKRLNGVEGSMHLPQVDVGVEATARAEARGHSGVRGVMGDESQHRLYPTMRDRIANDPEFEPQLDPRILLAALDNEKASRAADNVFRAGLGGKRKSELVAQLNPGLEAKYRDLQHQTQALRGMSARANEAARRALAVERAAGTIDAKQIRRENALVKAQIRARQLETVARGGFISDVLPEKRVLEGEIARVKGELDRNPAGELRQTRANADRIELLGELETQYDVRGTLDTFGGDVEKAIDSLEVYNRDLGTAFEYRQSLSIRAQAGNRTKRQERLQLRSGFEEVANFPDAQGEFALVKAHSVTLNRYLEDLRVKVDDFNADPDMLPEFELLQARIDELTLRDEAIQANIDAAQLAADRLRDRDGFRQALAQVKLQYDDVKKAYQGQNTRGWVRADSGTGLFRYYPTEAASHINRLAEAHQHPYQRWVAELNATVLSGDTSPITGVQIPLAFMFSPKASVQQVREQGFLNLFRHEAIVDAVRKDPEWWADFASFTGRALPQGTPDEFAGGLLARVPEFTIPFTGGKRTSFSTLNEGAYSAVLQFQKRMFKDAAVDMIARGIDPIQAKAAAADVVTKAIPTLNTRRLGQSSQQAALQRLPFTSISFMRQPAALMSEAVAGYAKMATGKQLTETERLSAVMMAKLVGTATALASGSASLSALQAGDDPIAAGLNAIDPRHASFMAITIGDRRIPIGGPYRSLMRAIAPREVETGAGRFPMPFVGLKSFVLNRQTPILKTAGDLYRNKDFFGDDIRTQEGVVGIGQQLIYAFSGAAPISVGEAVRGVSRGDSMEEILLGAAASFGGVNLQEQSPLRGFDRLAQRSYGRNFYDLEPWQREVLKEQNPGLWEKRIRQGSENFQRAEAVRTVLYEKQLGDDRALVDGSLSREDWRDARGKRRDEQRFRLQEIYGDHPITDPQNAYERYLELVRQNEVDGKVDWTAVDVAVQGLPTADREDIRKSVGIGQTPLSREYARQISAYVKLPRYKGYTAAESTLIDDTWQEIINEAGDDKLRRLRAVRKWVAQVPPNVATALRRRAIGTTLTRDGAREDFRAANPLLDALLKDGKLQPADQEVLAKYGSNTRSAA